MRQSNIEYLLHQLMEKKISVKGLEGRIYEVDLIHKEGKILFEQIIRESLADDREQKIGALEAKVFMYEQIISKSNFSPMIDNLKNIDEIHRDGSVKIN